MGEKQEEAHNYTLMVVTQTHKNGRNTGGSKQLHTDGSYTDTQKWEKNRRKQTITH